MTAPIQDDLDPDPPATLDDLNRKCAAVYLETMDKIHSLETEVEILQAQRGEADSRPRDTRRLEAYATVLEALPGLAQIALRADDADLVDAATAILRAIKSIAESDH